MLSKAKYLTVFILIITILFNSCATAPKKYNSIDQQMEKEEKQWLFTVLLIIAIAAAAGAAFAIGFSGDEGLKVEIEKNN